MVASGQPDETELIRAAMRGNVQDIERLLSMDRSLQPRLTLLSISSKKAAFNINATDKMGRTALHWIASQGHASCVDTIMEHLGTTPLVSNNDGRTPLHEAAMKGHGKMVAELLEHKIFLDDESIDKVDCQNRTALHWAARRGHWAIIDLLIAKGASINIISTDGESALSLAANANDEGVLQMMFRAWAAQGGDERIVREFVGHGKTQVDTKDDGERTLLSYASEKGYGDSVKLLIENGADIEAKDKSYGRTPLLWAAEGGHEGVVKLLVEKGANIKVKDEDGRTPLSWASGRVDENIVKLLHEKLEQLRGFT